MYTMFSKIVRDFHFHSNIRGYLVIETWKLGYDLRASFGDNNNDNPRLFFIINGRASSRYAR